MRQGEGLRGWRQDKEKAGDEGHVPVLYDWQGYLICLGTVPVRPALLGSTQPPL